MESCFPTGMIPVRQSEGPSLTRAGTQENQRQSADRIFRIIIDVYATAHSKCGPDNSRIMSAGDAGGSGRCPRRDGLCLQNPRRYRKNTRFGQGSVQDWWTKDEGGAVKRFGILQ